MDSIDLDDNVLYEINETIKEFDDCPLEERDFLMDIVLMKKTSL